VQAAPTSDAKRVLDAEQPVGRHRVEQIHGDVLIAAQRHQRQPRKNEDGESSTSVSSKEPPRHRLVERNSGRRPSTQVSSIRQNIRAAATDASAARPRGRKPDKRGRGSILVILSAKRKDLLLSPEKQILRRSAPQNDSGVSFSAG